MAESAAHLEAKRLLWRWFDSQDEEVRKHETNQFSYMEWPVLFDEGWWGVNYGQIWADWGEETEPPSFDELCAKGTPPLLVFDIARVRKGGLMCLVEVKHKHAVDEAKLNKFRAIMADHWKYTNSSISLIEIEADEIFRCAATGWQTKLAGKTLYDGSGGHLAPGDRRFLSVYEYEAEVLKRHTERLRL